MIKSNIDLGGLTHLVKMSGGYFITTILNQALPFLILPIITRFLTPSEYGNVALFSFYLVLSNALSGSSIPTVISKHFFSREKEYIARIIGNCILIVAFLSLIIFMAIIIFYPFLQSLFQLPLLWLFLIPITSFAFILFSMGLNVMRNTKKILTFSKHQIGNTAINLVISLIFIVLLMWGWHGRVWGIIISYIISAAGSYLYLKKNGFISFDVSITLTKTILKVIAPLIPNSVQVVIISQVGIFFIQYYFTKELLGLYSIGFQIAVMIKLFSDTINMSWSPYLYEQISGRVVINKLYLTRLLLTIIGLLIMGVIFINLFAGVILRVMTTQSYYGAREFVPWFTFGFMFYGIYVLFFPILIKYENQKYISVVSFINMFVMIVLNVWFIKLFGHIGIAYAFCCTYFLMFLAFFWKAQKVMPLPWLKAIKIYN